MDDYNNSIILYIQLAGASGGCDLSILQLFLIRELFVATGSSPPLAR